MKIVFVQPIGSGTPHLGLMYLIGVLKKEGYEDIHLVSLTEPPASEKRSYKYLMNLLKQKPDIVGVTSTTPEWTKAAEICKVAKEYSDVVMVGGPGPSIFPIEILEKYPFIDVVVFGEADNTIHKIVDRIERHISLEGIKGTAYRDNGKIIMNDPNPLIKDLDSIPYPDRDCLLDIETYHAPFSVFTSRGCPHGCVFCFKPVHGNVWRARSAQNVVDEIEFLLSKYPKTAKRIGRTISFADDIFNFDINRAKQICDEIIARNLDIKLVFENGFHVRHVDYELFQKLKKAGCVDLWFGVDSGHPEILKKIKKGITVDMVREAVKLARKAGIPMIGAHFIIGLTDETIETARSTIALAKQLDLDAMGFNHANILPGTELWNWVMKHGKLLYPIENMDYSMYKQLNAIPVFETPEFSAEQRKKVYSEAVALMDSVFRRNCLSPRKILKTALSLRSLDDILWASKKLYTILLKKNLRLQPTNVQPSLLKKNYK